MKAGTFASPIQQELDGIFYQRTRLGLWLGAIFFLIFALLDFVSCRPHFQQFLAYRLIFAGYLLIALYLLRFDMIKRYSRLIMFSAMLLGALVIALMARAMGGFTSGYYVGILLIIAGGGAVLPLSALQSLLLGTAIYLVYLITLLYETAFDMPNIQDGMVDPFLNSFFFFIVIGITAVQSYDELHILLRSLKAKHNLRTINNELRHYTGNLETLVQQRLEKLEESNIKFRDLYNNILDLVVMVDTAGRILMINRHGAVLLEQPRRELEGRPLTDFMPPRAHDLFHREVLQPLHRQGTVRGVQLQLLTYSGQLVEVEINGNPVLMPEEAPGFQLILRDITATKAMERKMLESQQLRDGSRQAAIFGLARLTECRDDATGAHLMRIQAYTRILATALARQPNRTPPITRQFIEDLCVSSVLHDIGKIGIPDSILLKPQKLSAREFSIMQLHCEYGYNALASAEKASNSPTFLRLGQEIAYCHHEHWNGQGYPRGLRGTDIPLSARIVALADVYDALTSSRPYKRAFSHDEAREIILAESGQRFDPEIVAAFREREQEFRDTYEQARSQGLPHHT
ncbi:MAG: HD-GYP domain-containing protein [Desulfobulbus sp.]|jgi:PAS domain S-box-containing protein